MVVFLANRANLQNKRLHDRIQNRLSGTFENVRRRRLNRVKRAHTGSSLR